MANVGPSTLVVERTETLFLERMPKLILRNALECRKCGQIIESKSVHDFVYCSCRSIFVDGGHEYLRRGGNLEDMIERSEMDYQEID